MKGAYSIERSEERHALDVCGFPRVCNHLPAKQPRRLSSRQLPRSFTQSDGSALSARANTGTSIEHYQAYGGTQTPGVAAVVLVVAAAVLVVVVSAVLTT